MVLFSRRLARGEPVGDALRQAKADYLNRTGMHSFSPYDEKVLAQTTLYGLPMARLDVTQTAAADVEVSAAQFADLQPVTGDLTSRQVVLAPTYVTHTVDAGAIQGAYFSVADEIEVNEGQPIQPRTGVDVTLAGQEPHGIFFEGGRYEVLSDFDPVISRVITDTTALPLWQVEPAYFYPETWQPSEWAFVNRVWTPEEVKQRLVVIPAQYRSDTVDRGTERLFRSMTFKLYYSPAADMIPPSVWRVTAVRQSAANRIAVEVTDLSDVLRVGAAYTLGDGVWAAVDLARSAGDPDLWTGTLPDSPTLEWFVQVVDAAGNVAVADNRGAYFGQGDRPVWLPMVTRGAK